MKSTTYFKRGASYELFQICDQLINCHDGSSWHFVFKWQLKKEMKISQLAVWSSNFWVVRDDSWKLLGHLFLERQSFFWHPVRLRSTEEIFSLWFIQPINTLSIFPPDPCRVSIRLPRYPRDPKRHLSSLKINPALKSSGFRGLKSYCRSERHRRLRSWRPGSILIMLETPWWMRPIICSKKTRQSMM